MYLKLWSIKCLGWLLSSSSLYKIWSSLGSVPCTLIWIHFPRVSLLKTLPTATSLGIYKYTTVLLLDLQIVIDLIAARSAYGRGSCLTCRKPPPHILLLRCCHISVKTWMGTTHFLWNRISIPKDQAHNRYLYPAANGPSLKSKIMIFLYSDLPKSPISVDVVEK